MGLKYKNMDKVWEFFYEYPQKSFTVREIAISSKIPKSTAQKYLLFLKKEKFVDQENRAGTSLLFKMKKINFYTEKIVASGLIDEFIAKLNPSCIILFGSIRKGDSVKESDIDIFIESPVQKKIELTSFEKKLGHSVQLFVEQDIHHLPPQLFNNVVNGIKLYGSFKVK